MKSNEYFEFSNMAKNHAFFNSLIIQMYIAASEEIALVAEEKGLSSENIMPTMDNKIVFIREATAVGLKAIEQNIHRIKLTKDELFARADELITNSQESTKLLMNNNLIKKFNF